MPISIPSNLGQIDLEQPTSNVGYYNKQYSLFILQVIYENIDLHFRGSALYGRQYERSSIVDNIIATFPISTSESNLRGLWYTEDRIAANIKQIVKEDPYDGYGIYEVYRSITGTRTEFIIIPTGDYRVHEWEAGRGKDDSVYRKPQDISDLITEEDLSAEENFRVADAIFSRSTTHNVVPEPTISSPLTITTRDINVINQETRERLRMIASRIDEEKHVDEEDLAFYHENA